MNGPLLLLTTTPLSLPGLPAPPSVCLDNKALKRKGKREMDKENEQIKGDKGILINRQADIIYSDSVQTISEWKYICIKLCTLYT